MAGKKKRRAQKRETKELEIAKKRKWVVLGGKEVEGHTLVIVKCPTGHHYIHDLKEYPHHDAIFTRCPECKLRRLLDGIFGDMDRE